MVYGEASGRGSECANRVCDANLLIPFHNNYGSILLSFPDMTMGLTTYHCIIDYFFVQSPNMQIRYSILEHT